MSGYKTTCPDCHGNNFYVTPHNGIGYCFNCSYTERDNTREHIPTRYTDITGIRQLYTELAHYYHACVDDARDYLHSRGITDQDIETYNIGYCPSSAHKLYADDHAVAAGIVKRDGSPFLANRVIFPYLNSVYVTDLRGRSLDPNDEIRYLSPYNGSFYRGADYPFLWSDQPSILTEGEFKAIAMRKIGLRAIGVPGIRSIRPKSVFDMVCFDSEVNPKSRADVHNAILRIARQYTNIKVITMPQSDRKMGADDYIQEFGADSFHRLVRSALPIETWKHIFL